MDSFKKYTFIVLFLVLSSQNVFSQSPFLPFFYNIYSIPNDSTYEVFYTFRIANDKLVFEKNDDIWKAGFKISLEITDTLGNFVYRTSKDKDVNEDGFEATNYNDKYTQGVLNFNLKPGSYRLSSLFYDNNSGSEFKLRPVTIKLDVKDERKSLTPIIVNAYTRGQNDEFIVTNFEGNIPFDELEYNILIPVKDTNVKQINVIVVNNKDTVYNSYVKEYVQSSLTIKEEDNTILLDNSAEDKIYNVFILRNLSRHLTEGPLNIYVSSDDLFDEKPFFKLVKWYNKPISLSDSEFAIESLQFIEKQDTIEKMLDQPAEEYFSILFKYWEKVDPTPNTKFNPLMKEYYSRVDYAARSFSSVSGKNGLHTDRGKVYIQYGKPKDINRTSDNLGKVVEIWTYERPNLTFYFIDEKGTGEFTLKNRG